MPELTEEQIHNRRRNAAAHLAAGSLMVGGAAAAKHHLSEKTGVKSNFAAAKEIAQTKKVLPKHAKFAGGWLGTRGVAAAGVPLAAMGAKNLLAPKPKHTGRLDIKDDVIGESVDRTAVGAPNLHQRPGSRKARLAEIATVSAGAGAGGMGGAALGRKLGKGRLRLAGVGLGTAAGATTGAIAAAPFARKAVRRSTDGEYDYSTERGVYRRGGVRKADGVIAPVILPKKEQKAQEHRKHKAAKLSLASAGLGVTALGLRSPALVKYGAGKSKRIAKLPGVQRIVQAEKKTTPASWNVGVIGTGVGSTAALNAYRMQTAENRAADRQIKKDEKQHNTDLAKALVPTKLFRPRPPKFAGIKPGGLRTVQTPTGMKQIRYRGSMG